VRDNKYLFRGEICVNGNDFAVEPIDAEPAKNPSIWIKQTRIEHQYEKLGEFWLTSQLPMSCLEARPRSPFNTRTTNWKLDRRIPRAVPVAYCSNDAARPALPEMTLALTRFSPASPRLVALVPALTAVPEE